MRCQICGSEIGNLESCFYCGADNKTVPMAPSDDKHRFDLSSADRKHLANLDVWGRLCAVLLGAIFLLQLLHLIYELFG